MYDSSNRCTAGLLLLGVLLAGCAPHRNAAPGDAAARADKIPVVAALPAAEARHYRAVGRVKYAALIITSDIAQVVDLQQLKLQAAQMNADLVVLESQEPVLQHGESCLEMTGRAYVRIPAAR